MPRARAAPEQRHGAARALVWLAALAADAGAIGAFLLLPWAEGRGVLAGRSFDGPGFARLLRNTDVVLGGWSGGPVALLLVAALFAAPVTALMAATLTGSAPLARHPARTYATAAALSATSAAVAGTLGLVVWLNGLLGDAPLAVSPALPGSIVASACALAAVVAAGVAGRDSAAP